MMYAKRTDANHAEIRDAMRAAGSEVWDASGAGGGFPDTVVYTPDKRLLLVEIKTPDGKLTAAQVKFHARFPVAVVRSVTEAVNLIHPPEPDDGTFSSHPKACGCGVCGPNVQEHATRPADGGPKSP